ncbi:hypothetical protein PRZ48_004942 [Zasmidium cellare]|uniref:Uncharacterized protein n=1 Tax=Zasmidium cellare TaxID=395010 RepID=A0ABR0ER58_ZASCE|nr:hypothetical protein PRZ48_004942 [Zasmidium cellare]
MGALLVLPLSLVTFVLAQEASSTGIGDYVAQGVGMGSAAAPGFTGTATANSDDVNRCYFSWNEYWSASQFNYNVSYKGAGIATYATTTYITTETETYPSLAPSNWTQLRTEDATIPVLNGGFTISEQTVHTTFSSLYKFSGDPASAQTWTQTVTESLISTVSSANKTVPKPTCTLPSVVQDCQNKWETYITSRLEPSPTPPPHCDINAGIAGIGTTPACAEPYWSAAKSYYTKLEDPISGLQTPVCTAASISGSLCQSVRDAYQMSDVFAPTFALETLSQYGDKYFFNQGTAGLFQGNGTKWIWPTSSTMGNAPSCTLGCGRCAVTGGTVQLIYWPPTATPIPTATQNNNATLKARATEAPIVTVEALGTTFTSPTLYIAYRSLYAENACGTVGTEIGETILAIPTDKPLSSIYAPFTVEDLHEPVPYSIYSSQPWCQTYIKNNQCSGTCPTTEPYKPILVVNNDLLRGLQSDWNDCWGDIRGVYDPPLALTGARTEDVPMNTFGPVAQSATPASGPASNDAAPMATAPPETSSPSTGGEAVPSVPRQSGSPSASAKSAAPESEAPAKSEAPKQSDTPTPSPDQPSQAQSPNQPSPSEPQPSNAAEQNNTPAQSADSPTQASNPLPSNPPQSDSGSPTAATVDPQSDPSPPSVVIVDPHPASASPTIAIVDSQLPSAIADPSQAIQVINGDHTAILTAGAPAVTVGSQIMQAGPSGGIIIGTGATASFIDPVQAPKVATVNDQVFSLAPVANQPGPSTVQVVNGDHTAVLTAGAPAVTVGGQVMSAPASGGGVVVGTGADASTITAVQAASAGAYTMSALSNGVQVVNGGQTETLTPGGSAVTVGTDIMSAASSGKVVIGTGSTASTVDVGQSSASSGSALQSAQGSPTSSTGSSQSSGSSPSSSTSSSGSSAASSTARSSTTSNQTPSGTTATATSASNAAPSRNLASSGAFVAALLFGVLAL